MTSQKLKFVKLGFGQHIQKEQDEKSPLEKNSLLVQIGKEINNLVPRAFQGKSPGDEVGR